MDNNLSKSFRTETERSQQWENCSVHHIPECSGSRLKSKIPELSENQKGKYRFYTEELTVQWEIRNNHYLFHILHSPSSAFKANLKLTENNAEECHNTDHFNDKIAGETHC